MLVNVTLVLYCKKTIKLSKARKRVEGKWSEQLFEHATSSTYHLQLLSLGTCYSKLTYDHVPMQIKLVDGRLRDDISESNLERGLDPLFDPLPLLRELCELLLGQNLLVIHDHWV